jgi:hypothetical protein
VCFLIVVSRSVSLHFESLLDHVISVVRERMDARVGKRWREMGLGIELVSRRGMSIWYSDRKLLLSCCIQPIQSRSLIRRIEVCTALESILLYSRVLDPLSSSTVASIDSIVLQTFWTGREEHARPDEQPFMF